MTMMKKALDLDLTTSNLLDTTVERIRLSIVIALATGRHENRQQT